MAADSGGAVSDRPETRDSADTTGRDVRTVSGLTLASRLLGLVRDLITVRVFGDTAIGSAFAAAFAIPNLFRRLFGEGALSAAFLPTYTQLSESEPSKARALASKTVRWLVMVTGVLTLLGAGAMVALIATLPPDPDRTLSLGLIAAMLPFMPLICTAAILGGMLQAHGRFGPWAAAPIILNLCLIGTAAGYFLTGRGDAEPWAYALAGAAVLSGVLQVLWSLAALRPYAPPPASLPVDVRGESRDLFARFLPAVIGLGTLQINALIDTLIAMWPVWVGSTVLGYDYPLDEASNAILFYTQRLYQFPLGVFGIAVATVAFPQLSRAAARDRTADNDPLADTLRKGLRLSLFIGLPASAGLFLVADDLVRTVLTGGDGFSEDGAARSVAALKGYAVAVWAYSLNHVFVRAFYAVGDTVTPVRIAAFFVGVNLALNLTLIWFFREAGMAWATAASAVLQTVTLAFVLRSKQLRGRLADRDTVKAVGRMALATAVMVVALSVLDTAFGTRADWGRHAAALGVLTVGGAGVFTALAARLEIPELKTLMGSVRGKL
ncbi:MAG: murein biosynthesis integral membrane protein MurJ [Planctomycetota bacterium]